MEEIKKDFFKTHKENRSIFILAWRIIGLEIIILVLKYITSLAFIETGESRTFSYIFFSSVIINFTFAISLFTNWLYHYYIVTEDGVSINIGFIFRRSRTFDFRSIKSVRVKQGLVGKIFNYGTIELEIPGVKKTPILHSLPNPFEYGKIIEEQRLKYLERESRHEEVVPAIVTEGI